ncbi:MAG TPA: transporter [Gemmatimonadaceae bacterium]|nr:transporter [Gemmatimonadaceae bacterium]
MRLAIVVGVFVLVAGAASAQAKPAILGGLGLDTWTRGLGIDAGSQGPPGLYLIYRTIDFRANTARDGKGDALPIAGLRINALANAFAVAYTAKPRGAPYLTVAASIPIAAVSFDSDVPSAAFDNLGLADIFVAPIRVGWRQPHYDLVTSYGFYAPTGRWDPQDVASVGRGYWINQFTVGGALYLDTARHRRGSVLVSFERNQRRRGIESTRGNLLQVQGGAGTTVYPNVIAGVAWYALRQVSDDKGAGLALELAGARSRAYGLGPEIDLIIPRYRMRVDARVEWEFDVVARPQGIAFVIGAGRLAWMPRRPNRQSEWSRASPSRGPEAPGARRYFPRG